MTRSALPFLNVRRDRIVDEDGHEVRLRGFCVGGWMNLENFINGYPGHPHTFRAAMERVHGPGKAAFFFDRMMDHFLAEDDVRFMASLGVNTLRVPFNYRHFEDDAKPFAWKESGFRRLDRAIEWCGRHGIYVILDLHAAQGWQNPDWHSDNPTNVALLWSHPHFQDRVVALWEELARRYRRNPAVAGYNFLNEPVCGVPGGLSRLYRRLGRAVRKHDRAHIIFLEGNAFSRDFSEMGEFTAGNTVLSNHTYPAPGLITGPYPGKAWGRYHDRSVLKRDQEAGTSFMARRHLPVWTGEFGAIFRGTPRDADRLRVVEDSISIFNELGHHWTIWTYKDIGMMGTVHLDPGSPWMRLTAPYRGLKARIGSETWGQTPDAVVARLVTSLRSSVRRESVRSRFRVDDSAFGMPFGLANRMVGGMLVSEMLLPSFAGLFRGMSEKRLDGILQSFAFRNCAVRDGLADVIRRGSF
jgi:hypothetical protein